MTAFDCCSCESEPNWAGRRSHLSESSRVGRVGQENQVVSQLLLLLDEIVSVLVAVLAR